MFPWISGYSTRNNSIASNQYKSLSISCTQINDKRFHRTKLIICKDRYIVVNGTAEALDIRQVGSLNNQHIMELHPGKYHALSWGRGIRNINVKRANIASSLWSGSISMDFSNECTLQLRDRRKLEVQYLTVSIEKSEGCTILRFMNMRRSAPPYRIDNHTNKLLRYRQRTWGNSSTTQIFPYHSCAFALDEPMNEPIILIEQFVDDYRNKNRN